MKESRHFDNIRVVPHAPCKNKVRLSVLKSALLQFSAMFCGVIAFWKLERKCKRLLILVV